MEKMEKMEMRQEPQHLDELEMFGVIELMKLLEVLEVLKVLDVHVLLKVLKMLEVMMVLNMLEESGLNLELQASGFLGAGCPNLETRNGTLGVEPRCSRREAGISGLKPSGGRRYELRSWKLGAGDSVQDFDTRCHLQIAGHWTLNTLDAGYWTLETGHSTLVIGNKTLEKGYWELDTGHSE